MNRTLKERQGLAAIVASMAMYLLLFLYRAPQSILNDDVDIEIILSCAYSDTPDMHTVYMGEGLSFLLSLLYRQIPLLHWFGLLCLLTVIFSSSMEIKKYSTEGFTLIVMFFKGCALMLHYTVVAACAGCAALSYRGADTYDTLPSDMHAGVLSFCSLPAYCAGQKKC